MSASGGLECVSLGRFKSDSRTAALHTFLFVLKTNCERQKSNWDYMFIINILI